MRVHHVVAASPDDPAQPEQRGQLGVAAHPECADAAAVAPDHVGHRAGVIEGDDVGVMPGLLKDGAQLKLGSADAQASDHMQHFHAVPPRAECIAPDSADVSVRTRMSRSSQTDQYSM